MDQRLQEMLDHYEICKTLKDYCHGCDRSDESFMRSVYTEDSWDEHGSVSLAGKEFAQVMTGRVLDTTDSLAHLLGQTSIGLRGDEAGAETYFLAVSHSTREDGVKMCNQLGGRFVDTLVRVDQRWRIKHRVVIRDWSISVPVEADWTADAGLLDGMRSGDDPAIGALGRIHGGNSFQSS